MERRQKIIGLILFFLSVGAALWLGNLPLKFYFTKLVNTYGEAILDPVRETGRLDSLGLTLESQYFYLFFPFVLVLLAMILSYPLWLKRPWKEIIRPMGKIRWKLFFQGGLLWLGLAILADLINYGIDPQAYRWAFNLQNWLKLNLILIMILPIQTAAEEFFFRGMLLDYLGAWRGHPQRALWISSFFFAFLHLTNPEIREYGFWLMMPQYLAMACFFAYIAVKDGGLERAWGIHFFNNWYGISLVYMSHSAVPSHPMVEVIQYRPLRGGILLILSMLAFLLIQFLLEKRQPHQS